MGCAERHVYGRIDTAGLLLPPIIYRLGNVARNSHFSFQAPQKRLSAFLNTTRLAPLLPSRAIRYSFPSHCLSFFTPKQARAFDKRRIGSRKGEPEQGRNREGCLEAVTILIGVIEDVSCLVLWIRCIWSMAVCSVSTATFLINSWLLELSFFPTRTILWSLEYLKGLTAYGCQGRVFATPSSL
jgi:hypothetical protein